MRQLAVTYTLQGLITFVLDGGNREVEIVSGGAEVARLVWFSQQHEIDNKCPFNSLINASCLFASQRLIVAPSEEYVYGVFSAF